MLYRRVVHLIKLKHGLNIHLLLARRQSSWCGAFWQYPSTAAAKLLLTLNLLMLSRDVTTSTGQIPGDSWCNSIPNWVGRTKAVGKLETPLNGKVAYPAKWRTVPLKWGLSQAQWACSNWKDSSLGFLGGAAAAGGCLQWHVGGVSRRSVLLKSLPDRTTLGMTPSGKWGIGSPDRNPPPADVCCSVSCCLMVLL